MAIPTPVPLTFVQMRARLKRITVIARELKFRGVVEYRHVYSGSGGAYMVWGAQPSRIC